MRTTLVIAVLGLIPIGCDDAPSSGAGAEPAAAEAEPEAGGIGAFTEYQRKSMAAEAKVNVAGLVAAVRIAYEQESVDPETLQVVTHRLPSSAPMTPPAGSCCKQPEGTCKPDPSQWEHPAWQELLFAPADPIRFSYEVIREGETVTIKAVADLDCDGKLSSYQSTGKVVDGELSFPAELEINDPLE
ncbi:MAG: hypothetical protein H6712_21475 [Myxococcales bacterium]|nr:hypothetical protein [Myxococcales bacterium]MCB9716448.1 hypothetical protein [Myxococcales bacterium]